MIPLTLMNSGDTFTIKKITGKNETKHHLENLGFTVGETITVISEFSGNLILNVKGARIALDKSMANRIMI